MLCFGKSLNMVDRNVVVGPLFLRWSEESISLYFHNTLRGIKGSWHVLTRSERGADKHNRYSKCE